MELIHEFTLSATLKPPLEIGAVPIGRRSYFEVESGEVSGARLNGRVLGGLREREIDADWPGVRSFWAARSVRRAPGPRPGPSSWGGGGVPGRAGGRGRARRR